MPPARETRPSRPVPMVLPAGRGPDTPSQRNCPLPPAPRARGGRRCPGHGAAGAVRQRAGADPSRQRSLPGPGGRSAAATFCGPRGGTEPGPAAQPATLERVGQATWAQPRAAREQGASPAGGVGWACVTHRPASAGSLTAVTFSKFLIFPSFQPSQPSCRLTRSEDTRQSEASAQGPAVEGEAARASSAYLCPQGHTAQPWAAAVPSARGPQARPAQLLARAGATGKPDKGT